MTSRPPLTDKAKQVKNLMVPPSGPRPKEGRLLWVVTPTREPDIVSPIGKTFVINKVSFFPPLRRKRYLYTKNPSRPSRRLSSVKTLGPQGRAIRSIGPRPHYRRIALEATLRAAAPFQLRRGRKPKGTSSRLLIKPRDLRFQVCCGPVGWLVLFLVDASGSMGAENRMVATKGAILSLLSHVYQYRERVSLITFHRKEAMVKLSPTRSVEMAGRQLDELPTGGTTPLPKGLERAYEVIERERLREPALSPLLITVTDGRANIPLEGGEAEGDAVQESYRIARILKEKGVQSVVIDTNPHAKATPAPRRKALLLARELGARYYHLKDLEKESVIKIVAEELGRITEEII